MSHSRLAASASGRWIRCPGSVAYIEFLKKEKRIPENSTNSAAELGTAVHGVIEHSLINSINPEALNKRQIKKLSPKILLDSKAISNAASCYQWAINTFDDGEYDELFAEKKYDLSFIYNIDVGGTADITLLKQDEMAVIADYKNGRTVVEVNDNYQCKMYDLGVYYDQHEWYDFDKITNVIIQPNAPHPDGRIRAEIISVDSLKHFEEKELIPAIDLIENNTAQLNPGPIQCEWCDARHLCPANAKSLGQLANIDFEHLAKPKAELPAPNTLTRKQLAFVLDNKQRMFKFFAKCEEYAEQAIEEGERIGDYFLDSKVGNRKYISEKKVKSTIRKNKLTIKECTITPEPHLMSVTQLESYLKQKWDKDQVYQFMSQITERPITGKKLAKALKTAELDFSKAKKSKTRKHRKVK